MTAFLRRLLRYRRPGDPVPWGPSWQVAHACLVLWSKTPASIRALYVGRHLGGGAGGKVRWLSYHAIKR